MIEAINKAVDEYALSISSELSEIRFWEIDKIKAAISTRIKLALIDCIEIQAFEMEADRLRLSTEYQQATAKKDGKAIERLKTKIIEVNHKLKKVKRLRHHLQDEAEYIKLKNFLREKGLENVMNEFFEKVSPPRESVLLQIKNKTHQ